MKNKNKVCSFKKLSVFYNSCLKTFGSHLVYGVTLAKTVTFVVLHTGITKKLQNGCEFKGYASNQRSYNAETSIGQAT
jgi:hypothetical protein